MKVAYIAAPCGKLKAFEGFLIPKFSYTFS